MDLLRPMELTFVQDLKGKSISLHLLFLAACGLAFLFVFRGNNFLRFEMTEISAGN